MNTLRPAPLSGLSRRELLQRLFWTAGAVTLSPLLPSRAVAANGSSAIANAGPLGEPDANGIRLPAGWTSRIVAVSGKRPASSRYVWHPFPDGGASFALPDGGWVYANNSESIPGGVGVLRFNAGGQVVNAYATLKGTRLNCAGGPTPWQTWLSCEEYTAGRVWETYPAGTAAQARARTALGVFSHEAVAVDPANRTLYLTEDDGEGRFYRFVCSRTDWPAGSNRPALQDGQLQVMEMVGVPRNSYPSDTVNVLQAQAVTWADVKSPLLPQQWVRASLGAEAPGVIFKGGEGLWDHAGLVYFSTKGDNRIWAYDAAAGTVQVIYDFATSSTPVLSGVDNLTVSSQGDILVAEDGGNMELCAILPDLSVKVILQIVGQDNSEITGPAFSPDGRRLYLNSQRGGLDGAGRGLTYEIQIPG